MAFILAAGSVLAQENHKILNVQESSEDGIGVYPCGDRHEAMVQFVTSEPFRLEFSSNMDAELALSCDSLAGKKTYSIVFVTQAPGEDFSARKLTVMAPGFQSQRLALPLKDKQKLVFVVSDPYSQLRSPFFNYLETAQDAYQKGDYQLAKDQYELCRYCPEYENDSARINEHMAICDSLMKWYDDALEYGHYAQYKKEAEMWRKMMGYSSNEQLRANLFAAQDNFMQDCDALARMAEAALNEENLDRAEMYYRQIQENGCFSYTAVATTALSQIRKMRMRRDDHATTLLLMSTGNTWGLSWGNFYTSRKSGWYGTVLLNMQDFDVAMQKIHVEGAFEGKFNNTPKNIMLEDVENNHFVRQDLVQEYGKNRNNFVPEDGKLDYEVTVSFGCAWHVWEPIFIHLGAGYRGGGFCDFSDVSFVSAANSLESNTSIMLDDPTTWDYGFKYDYSKVNWFSGLAPEIGLVLKYWRAALKVTYQYTFWFNDRDYEDFLVNNRNQVMFGVGFCW